jgi:hypothetical protein
MHMHMHCTCSHGIPHLIAIIKNHMSNGSKWVEMGRNGGGHVGGKWQRITNRPSMAAQ